MSLHASLMDAALDWHGAVQGIEKSGTRFARGAAEGTEFTAIVGGVETGDDMLASGEFDRKRKVERRVLRILSPAIAWLLTDEVLLAGDPVRWQVDRIQFAGTRAPVIHLKRSWTMEQGRSGRKR